MAEITGIAWTTSSWNPWIGCTEVSPGCDNCYARELDRRNRYGGGVHWGAGIARYRTKTRDLPFLWNRKAEKTGTRWTVFPSLCDPFDNEVPEEWRRDFWEMIELTPALTWLLLTKRIGNAMRMLPPDFTKDGGPPLNVWIGASVVNQEEADRDIPKLLSTPAAKRFVSYEPALGPIDFAPYLGNCEAWDYLRGQHQYGEAGDAAGIGRGVVVENTAHLDWVIVGGESAQGRAKARPFVHRWGKDVVAQCRFAGVAVFVKQMGSNAVNREGERHPYKDRAGADPAEWPADLRVQEFPT